MRLEGEKMWSCFCVKAKDGKTSSVSSFHVTAVSMAHCSLPGLSARVRVRVLVRVHLLVTLRDWVFKGLAYSQSWHKTLFSLTLSLSPSLFHTHSLSHAPTGSHVYIWWRGRLSRVIRTRAGRRRRQTALRGNPSVWKAHEAAVLNNEHADRHRFFPPDQFEHIVRRCVDVPMSMYNKWRRVLHVLATVQLGILM